MRKRIKFHYTREEQDLLADCLPGAPAFVEKPRIGSYSLSGGFSLAEWQENKGMRIADYLETQAAYTLEEYFRSSRLSLTKMPSKADDLATVKRIIQLASELRDLLAKESSYRSNYAIAFFGWEAVPIEKDHRWQGKSYEIVLQALQEIETYGPETLLGYTLFHDDHRPLDSGEFNGRNTFVSGICRFWEAWNDRPIPKTRHGGPAAKFVFHALEPFLRFVYDKSGERWLRNWPLKLDGSQVNEMILSYREKREERYRPTQEGSD